ncbi:dnd system-associated protein 4 [Mycobacteroides abscessus subsp. massiliense]|nr:DNA phosphorothioation-associated protein 4 [Mycobacteroides abscessus]SHV98254.1 dnd system-associated protein 4 [Mycobacteroides abscessus subsp. abscessus]SKE06254.1 dnd system-associated protein 4 [Mycobacteroides abscessus subsp. massiliense]SHW98494.1 dnd system-associated protein 4 [Mycobacteroides abscessus subsp. abscessus]SIB24966.1 dnd system-associated protein 4 [Mycobacteroides abscessus subsp. abscessus]
MQEMQSEAKFPTYRDILLFAAAVGYHQQRRVPFTASSGDPIRYEVLTYHGFSDTLINMIAANVVSDDPEIMDGIRLEERIKIFEEFANGGLEYIQEQINVRHQPVDLIVIELVTDVLADNGGAKQLSVGELLGGVSWS